MFASQRDEIDLRKQFRISHNEELCDFYRSPVRKVQLLRLWTGNVALMGKSGM
jgi:hypothetical protein